MGGGAAFEGFQNIGANGFGFIAEDSGWGIGFVVLAFDMASFLYGASEDATALW